MNQIIELHPYRSDRSIVSLCHLIPLRPFPNYRPFEQQPVKM